MLPVSFGAMLMESMLAILALIAVASFGKGEAAAQGLTTQPQIFAGAIANFLSVIGLPHSLVFTLINLAVSAFALTSLDSVPESDVCHFRSSGLIQTQMMTI